MKTFISALCLFCLTAGAADVKVSDLPAATNPSTNTWFLISDMNAVTKSQKFLATNYVMQSQIDTSAEVQAILGQVYQATNSNLTGWSGVAATSVGAQGLLGQVYQATNSNLTGWAGVAATSVGAQNLLGQVYQATNGTLTTLSGATPTINGDLNVTGTITNSTTQTDTLYLSSLTETNKVLGLGATTNAMVATAGMVTNTLGIALTSNALIGSIGITIDGGGSAITTGIKGDVYVPYACTINSVTMLADTAGAAVVDIWVDSYANYPPTDADSITSAAVPTITASNVKSQDTTLTGWDTAIAAGDTIRFNVDSAATITRLTLVLKVTK